MGEVGVVLGEHARMRAEAPVFYYEPLDAFVLTRHEDIRFVNRNPGIFSNARGIFLNDVRYQQVQTDGPTMTTRSSRRKGSRSEPPTRRGTMSSGAWCRRLSPSVRSS